MLEPNESLVLARAKLNFTRTGHGDRCWDSDVAACQEIYGRTLYVLTQGERDEFLEQARHELRHEPRDG